MRGSPALLRPGLFAEVPGAGLLWSSRRWSVKSDAVPGPQQPLFTVAGRSALDLWAEGVQDRSRRVEGGEHGGGGLGGGGIGGGGGGGASNELYHLHVIGVGGDVRRELARADLRSGFKGRLLSLRDIVFPEVQVTIDVDFPGSYPSLWRFYCASWGREPSHDDAAHFERSNNTEGAVSGPSPLISDCACSLDWLEFSLVQDAGESELWAQLYDTNPLLGFPDFDFATLRAQWPLRLGGALINGGTRQVSPRKPLPFYSGAYLVLSTTADVFTPSVLDPQPLIWAHWQRRPTVQLPWRDS